MRVSRRFFLAMVFAVSSASILGWRLFREMTKKVFEALRPHEYPVKALTHADLRAPRFVGDNPEAAHAVLWRKQELFVLPATIAETAKLVIVGGGISGLASAYWLRDRDPILLEQATNLGGNSRGELWEDSRFSWAAAYTGLSQKGTASFDLLQELGLENAGRIEEGIGSIFFNSEARGSLWKGSSDPRHASAYRQAFEHLKRVYEEAYPDIPHEANSVLSERAFVELDQQTLSEWCQEHFRDFPLHLRKFIDGYCASSFGGLASEISAAQGLSFLASDIMAIRVFPGGNSLIAESLVHKLEGALTPGHLRSQTLVTDVRLEGSGVRVTYQNPDGTVASILAERCIMACPKFVAAKIIDDLPADQREAIRKLKYRAYVVMNLVLNKKMVSPGYDLFNLDHALSVEGSRFDLPYVDSIFAGWAQHDSGKASVITLYRPLAYDAGRPELLAKTFGQFQEETERAVEPLLRSLGLTRADIEGFRISRFGHAMPLAMPGLLADGICEVAHRPLKNKIFFAHQDNWANPSFETAAKVAWQASRDIMATDL